MTSKSILTKRSVVTALMVLALIAQTLFVTPNAAAALQTSPEYRWRPAPTTNGPTTASYTIAIDAIEPSKQNQPVTFGLPFREGEFRYNDYLNATVSFNGQSRTIVTQLDKKASHCATKKNGLPVLEFQPKDACADADRTLRHGIVTLELPWAMAKGERTTITLTPIASAPRGVAIEFPSDLDVVTNITIGGTRYVADLSLVPTSAFTNPPVAGSSDAQVSTWLNGTIVKEWIVRLPLVENGTGTEHSNLHARYNIRRYSSGDTKVDVVVENNWIDVPQAQSFTYAVDVNINGVKKYEDPSLNHFVHARWKVSLWADNYPELHVVHDPAQLIQSKAVPNYDPTLIGNLDAKNRAKYDRLWEEVKPSVSGDLLSFTDKVTYCFKSEASRSTTDCSAPGVFPVTTNTIGPMGIGKIPVRFMGMTGGRGDIAPLPKWTASYVLDQRYTAKKMMMAIADSAGSWPTHIRDEKTDRVVSVQDRPSIHIGTPPRSSGISVCARSASCVKPFSADTAHQPSFAYVPYLVSGDYYYLEEQQFWASYNAAKKAPGYRGGDKGLLEFSSQTRAQGWSLRTMTQTAYITPDSHKLKSHYLHLLKSNIEEYTDVYVSDPSRSNDYGVGTVAGRVYPSAAPWQNDYITYAAGLATSLGYESMRPFAQWKAKFPVKRMGFDNSSYCWIFGSNYQLYIAPAERVPGSENAETVEVQRGKGVLKNPKPQRFFKSIDDVWKYSNAGTNGGVELRGGGAINTKQPCASEAQAAEIGLGVGVMTKEGDTGMTAQMGPALAAAVDVGGTEAQQAWNRYANRNGQPSFAQDPQWRIFPYSVTPTADAPLPEATVSPDASPATTGGSADSSSATSSGNSGGPASGGIDGSVGSTGTNVGSNSGATGNPDVADVVTGGSVTDANGNAVTGSGPGTIDAQGNVADQSDDAVTVVGPTATTPPTASDSTPSDGNDVVTGPSGDAPIDPAMAAPDTAASVDTAPVLLSDALVPNRIVWACHGDDDPQQIIRWMQRLLKLLGNSAGREATQSAKAFDALGPIPCLAKVTNR